MARDPKSILRFLIPRYDELSLYLMSLSFLLSFLTEMVQGGRVHHFLTEEFEWTCYPVIIVAALFLMGIFFSILHVFTQRKKTPSEKTAMLYAAVIINVLSGLAVGSSWSEIPRGILMVFPVWNIVNAAVLMVMYYGTIVDESSVVDDNATPLQVIIGTVVVGTAFIVCRWGFELPWVITFSICVTYATNVDAIVQKAFLSRITTHR